MMKCVLFVAAAVAAFSTGSGRAHAEILQLSAEVHAGGAGGKGVGGARADDAFHAGAAGVSYGALVGVELFMLDGWIEHNQFQNASGLAGTWTQFMAGVDTRFDLSEKNRGFDAAGKNQNRYAAVYMDLGMAVGFGVGTGQQIDPPLDNSEVTDKGFMAQVQAGVGYRLTRSVSLGVSVPVQAGYFFKSGEGAANDQGTHYRSVHGAVWLNARVDLSIK